MVIFMKKTYFLFFWKLDCNFALLSLNYYMMIYNIEVILETTVTVSGHQLVSSVYYSTT